MNSKKIVVTIKKNFSLRKNDPYGFDRDTLNLYKFNKVEYEILRLIDLHQKVDIGKIVGESEQIDKFINKAIHDGIIEEIDNESH